MLAGDFGKLKVKPLILLVLSLLLGVPGFWLTIEGTIPGSVIRNGVRSDNRGLRRLKGTASRGGRGVGFKGRWM